MKFNKWIKTGFVVAAATSVLGFSLAAQAADPFITVQSTTSTQNSGLYEYLLPLFKKDTGIDVHVVAVGTGQAIKNAMRCDGDVLLVHAKPAELKFVASGYGLKRTDLMYNDFVIVGPKSDSAGLHGMSDAVAALKKIEMKKAIFASRGDDSGTYKKEMALWKDAGIDVKSQSGKWYRETGSGMGATLNTGIGMNAYILTDRATWIKFGNKGDYQIDVQGDPKMFNQYGIMLVNKAKCPMVKAKLGQEFIDWLLSPKGQKIIDEYKVRGQQLFVANAPKH